MVFAAKDVRCLQRYRAQSNTLKHTLKATLKTRCQIHLDTDENTLKNWMESSGTVCQGILVTIVFRRVRNALEDYEYQKDMQISNVLYLPRWGPFWPLCRSARGLYLQDTSMLKGALQTKLEKTKVESKRSANPKIWQNVWEDHGKSIPFWIGKEKRSILEGWRRLSKPQLNVSARQKRWIPTFSTCLRGKHSMLQVKKAWINFHQLRARHVPSRSCFGSLTKQHQLNNPRCGLFQGRLFILCL